MHFLTPLNQQVDYPFASERSKHYLGQLAENSRLVTTCTKVTDQLLETKMTLTEAEEKLSWTQTELLNKKALLHAVGIEDGEEVTGNALQDFLTNNEQVKEIGSKITSWVSSARKTGTDLNSTEPSDLSLSSDKFDWKKLGRGALLERIKQSQLVSTVSGSTDDSAEMLETQGKSTEVDSVGKHEMRLL
jgi:hypothetical protein